MKKSGVISVLVISLIVLSLSFSFVSASWIGDFWEKITGKAVTEKNKNCPYSFPFVSTTNEEDASLEDFVDILSVGIKQINNETLQFQMKLRGNPVNRQNMTFIWLVDSDNNKNTGQSVGDIGSDYNIRLFWNNNQWFTCIDDINSWGNGGEGCGFPFLFYNNTVYVVIKKRALNNSKSLKIIGQTFGDYGGDNKQSQGLLFSLQKNIKPLIVDITSDKLITFNPLSIYVQVNGSSKLISKSSLDYYFYANSPGIIRIKDNMIFDLSGGNYSKIEDFGKISIFEKNCGIIYEKPLLILIGNLYNGNSNKLVVPGSMIPTLEGNPNVPGNISFNEMIKSYSLMKVLDLNYNIQKELMGIIPLNGENQLWGFVYSACGFAGQPIGLGYGCIENPENEPHWGVLFHEEGHVFLDNIFGYRIRTFDSLKKIYYSEGFATLNSMYTFYKIKSNPNKYNLSFMTLESLKKVSFNQFTQKLLDYEINKDFSTINADIIDGIFIYLAENSSLNNFGWEVYPRFYKAFLPSSYNITMSERKGDTFFVAALSAATEDDLRFLFRDKWNFPIDDAYYNEIYPILVSIINNNANQTKQKSILTCLVESNYTKNFHSAECKPSACGKEKYLFCKKENISGKTKYAEVCLKTRTYKTKCYYNPVCGKNDKEIAREACVGASQ